MKRCIVWIKNKFVIILALAAPFLVYVMTVIPFLPVGANNDWAGFWGGYLGAIIGAFIAVYVMKKTISNERTMQEREEKREFLIQIVDIYLHLCYRI